jgi:hypothetical protein
MQFLYHGLKYILVDLLKVAVRRKNTFLRYHVCGEREREIERYMLELSWYMLELS